MPPPTRISPATLVLGDEDLLVSRAVSRIVDLVRAADPAADVVDLPAAGIDADRFDEISSPSLFGERRVLVIRDAHQAAKPLAEAILRQASAPADDIALVVTHAGGARGKALADGLRAAGAELVECPKPRWPEDRERFLIDEVAAAGGTITREAAQALLVALGTDLRDLANAAAQLAADSGGSVDEVVVARYHSGRADASSFAVADRAVEGNLAGALELLRWALGVGQSAAGMTAALAINLRTIAQVAGAGRSSSAQAVAAELRLPVWKVRKAQGWARGWHPEALGVAARAVAAADAAVKGAEVDAGFAVERAVLAVTAARNGT
ncbi:MAG TPA: DNA polymerase III subunit delta [Mycobacteriales bacterium]|nr:DNA polymerase III subunit delta [Mycobacteriales bacterium]